MSLPPSGILKATSAQMFAALELMLAKGADYAETLGIQEKVLLDARLFPDMFPFSRQVQIACDHAVRGGARMAGVELPSFPDSETTFAHLAERVDKANAFIQGLSGTEIDNRTDEEIVFPIGGGNEMTMKSWAFLLNYVLPNVSFHTSTAYNILRSNGVPLGKKDFLRPQT